MARKTKQELRQELVESICSKLCTPPQLTNVIKKGLPKCSPKELRALNAELDRHTRRLNQERRDRKDRILDEAKRLLLEEHDKIYGT